MKTISTLFAAVLLNISQSFAQTSLFENFEGETATSLTNTGWVISNNSIVMVETNAEINGSMTTRFDVASGQGTTRGSITTPTITFSNQLANVSFKYRNGALNTSATRTITFGWFDGTNFTQLGVITLNNASPTTVQSHSLNTTVTAGANSKLRFNLSGSGSNASDLYIDDLSFATTAMVPLPIKLLSFSSNMSNNKAQLSWSVADNETGDFFKVEKSTDGRNFTNIATLFTTNKIGTDAYSFRDADDLTSTTYYRLKIVNKDNSISYSKIVTLKTSKESAAASLAIVQNPVTSSTLQFQYTATTSSIGKAVLYNAAGVSVMSANVSLQKGSNALSLNLVNTINSGTYILEISNGTERCLAKLIKK